MMPDRSNGDGYGLVLLLATVMLAGACGRQPDPTPNHGSGPASDDGSAVTEYLAGNDGNEGFARALAPAELEFPRDHGTHPQFRTEWWYFTGNLESRDGRHYGFQLTFFRIALAPPGRERASRLAARQIWMAHLALTDTASGAFHFDERFERDALGLAGVETDPFRVWLNDWQVASIEEPFLPLAMEASTKSIALRLILNEGKPLTLQGDAGFDRKGEGPGAASYYYSFTRLPVAGTIRIADDDVEVSGLAWMDREWSSGALEPGLEGWDWFSLQLDDGSDLMFYRLRRNDQTMSPFSGGVLVGADGETLTRFSAADTELVATETWTSPDSGARYNVGWRLAVATLGLTLDLRPRVDNQELRLSVRYWEGAISATGTRNGSPLSGSGYAEYAGVPRP